MTQQNSHEAQGFHLIQLCLECERCSGLVLRFESNIVGGRRGDLAFFLDGAAYSATPYLVRPTLMLRTHMHHRTVNAMAVRSSVGLGPAQIARRRRAVGECEQDGRSPPQRQRTRGNGDPETLSGEGGRRKRRCEGGGEDFAREGRKRRRDAFGDG